MKDTIKDKAIYWAACEKEGLNSIEQKKLELWLNEDQKHKIAFDEAQNIYNIFQNIPRNYSEKTSQTAHRNVKRIRSFEKIKPVISYAAVFLIIFMAGFKTYDYYIPSFEASYISKNENYKSNILPDGSIVTIDVKTELDVMFLSNTREVILKKGQAFFDVTKDKNKAFIITSGKTQIKVLGTSFEVQKYNNSTNISVKEGIVRIAHIFNENKKPRVLTQLKQGETISVNNTGKINFLGKTSIDSIASWTEGKLIFNKNTLDEAFNSFSRYHDFELKSNTDLTKLIFSGKFKTNELDKFLNALEKVYSFEIRRNKNKIILSKKQNI